MQVQGKPRRIDRRSSWRALLAAPKLTAPVLDLADERDSGFEIAAGNLYEATPGTTRRLEAFLTEHAPPR